MQIVASNDQCNTISKNGTRDLDSVKSHGNEKQSLDGSSLQVPVDNLSFRILVCLDLLEYISDCCLHIFNWCMIENFMVQVFQQIPGSLLIKGSLQQKDSPLSG